MTDEERIEAAAKRHIAAQHAMQSGVAADIGPGFDSTSLGRAACTPKHLRVGVNSAMVDHASLVGLLVKRGVITMADYYEAIADGMEQEQKRYEALLSERMGGADVRLA